ncbi:ATP synthase F0 subcomplex subunit OSCP atp5 [Taxawa tesnikishii (nom. ined.)]|nr:ATP synthase F0 subcomplex subunit OSCP atp5 [Dothideales sp. JES 119]
MLSGRYAARAARVAAPRASIVPSVAVRGYAAPANQSTKPPVPLFGLDGTYASALYTAAAKTQTLDNTAKALENMNNVFKKDNKLQAILSAPTLSASDKSQIVAEIQKHAGVQDKGNTVKNFLNTLAENNRLSVLEGGEVEMIVTSAAPLDNKIIRQLETAVSKSQYVGQGKKLKVTPKVNPDIRGGLIVEIGERTIDLSVSAKMARMNKLLQDTL